MSAPEPAPPPWDDVAAVTAWRRGVHDGWGEEVHPGEPAHDEVLLGGVRCLVSGPAGARPVVYLHGGGYVLGSPGVAVPITARLAAAVRVVSVDYRLAPEHPFPAALDDAVSVYRAVAATMTPGPGPGPALAGDSAGGALAVGVALRARDEELPAPAALALLCPHLDHRVDGGGGTSPLTAVYRGSTPAEDPFLSPAVAPLAGLGPVLVQTTPGDALFGQAVRFARRARLAGVAVTLDVWWGLWHTWQYHRDLPEADRALAEAAAFLSVARP